jgi:assimilatory nitrate reductase catalytic subunit
MEGTRGTRAVRTTCPYCGVGCGVIAEPDGRGGAAIAGDPAHPANRGRLCSKGAALGETLGLADRLLHPEVNGKRASWDFALDAVAEGFQRALERFGPEGVALYVSGQLLTEDYYAANKFAKGVLGTGNIDSNSRLCMASAVAAHIRAFGEDVVPCTYEDLECCDLLVLVGSNLAWCHPVLFRRVAAAKAARPELRIVVVDPRRTATCEEADLHLPLAPGSDVALFAALLAELERRGLGDERFLATRTEGAETALAVARALAPEAARRTGLDSDRLRAFLDLWCGTERVVTLWSQGVNQSVAGTDKATAIVNCHLFSGRIGRPGTGPFSVTGQPNAMGGREVGALATALAGHLRFDVPREVEALRAFWRLPRLATRPGLKAVEMFEALARGRLGALWVMATNPAVSLPAGERVRTALARAPFLVVSEASRRSDTAGFAHVRLPALAWGEKDGTTTNSERVISRQRAFLPGPGEARPDWWIVAQVARRLGFGWAFDWHGPAAIFREHAAVTGLARPADRLFDLSGLADLDDAEYDALAPTRWPVPTRGMSIERPLPRRDEQGSRLRLVPTPFRPPAAEPGRGFPLRLLTGRVRDQWHTMTRTGVVPRLMAHRPEPLLTLHPEDAAGLRAGDLVRAQTPEGEAVFRLPSDSGLPRGAAFAPMHWSAAFAPAARVNGAIAAAVDPLSGQPELKHAPLRIRPFPARWHGFLLAKRRLSADLAAWCAVVPLEGSAWRHELAGLETPHEAFARLRALFAADAWAVYEDPAAGVYRAATFEGEGLLAVLAVAPRVDLLPPRGWLATLLASGTIAAEDRAALLAGRRPDRPPPSPVICVCHGVRADTIRACGGRDVESVGRLTGAGTGCGSCRPEIAALLVPVAG